MKRSLSFKAHQSVAWVEEAEPSCGIPSERIIYVGLLIFRENLLPPAYVYPTKKKEKKGIKAARILGKF